MKHENKIEYKRYICQGCEREFDNNPIFQIIEALFVKLSHSKCLFFYLRSQLEELKNEIPASCNQDASKLLTGSKIVFKDLFENPTDPFSQVFLAGDFRLIGGSDHVKAIKNLVAWNSAKFLSQSYEQFETYLKDVASKTLNINKKYLDSIKKSDYKNYKKSSLSSNDDNDWRMFVGYVLKNSTGILKFLKQVYPEIKKAEKQNYRNIDLEEWLEVFSEVRHAVTHSDQFLKADRVRSWPHSKKKILASYFSGDYNDENGSLLHITDHILYDDLKLIAEYSFLVYKSWSIAEGFEWEYFEKKHN